MAPLFKQAKVAATMALSENPMMPCERTLDLHQSYETGEAVLVLADVRSSCRGIQSNSLPWSFQAAVTSAYVSLRGPRITSPLIPPAAVEKYQALALSTLASAGFRVPW